MLDDAGHLVFIERFTDVNREVVRFLKAGDDRPARGTGGRSKGEEPSEGWFGGAMGVLRGWVARAKGWIGLS